MSNGYTIEDAPVQQAAPAASKYTVEDAAPPKKYLPGRQFGMDVAKGMGLDADKIKAAEDSGGQEAALKEIGSQVYEGLTGFLGSVAKDPFNVTQPLHGMASNLLNAKTPGEVVGALSTILGGTEAAKKTVAGAGAARESIGAKIHTPEGKLTPGAQLLGESAGTVVGGTLGHEILPGYGALAGSAAGYKLGPSLMEKMFPEPADAAEARQQAAAYQAKADDLVRRGKEQDALDRKAALMERLKGRQEAAGQKATVVSKQPLGPEAPEPPLGSPENPGFFAKLPTRLTAAQQELLQQQTPATLADLQGTTGRKLKIQSPESAPPPINKTYVSYPADMLVELAKKGDLNAIRELIRNPRGIKLSDIPNVGFLVEPGRRGVVYGGPQ